MSRYPLISIQCDWNNVLRLPDSAWIASKLLNEKTVQRRITSTINQADGKLKLNISNDYQVVSYSNLSLVLKHNPSGLKVAFIAPTKAHKVHSKGVISTSAAESALIVSSCDDDKLLVWDSRTSETILDLKGHGGPVYKCRFFPSGVVVLSAGADGSCKVWSAETGINPVTLIGHTMAVLDIAIVDRGRNVVSVSRDGLAKLWDVGESNCLADIMGGHGPINCCALGSIADEEPVENEREVGTGNKLLVVGCENGMVICTHVALRQQVFSKQLDAACNTCIVLDDSIIVGCENGKIIQLNMHNGTTTNEWHESGNPVISLCGLPHGLFAAGRQDGTCTVMSLADTHEALRVQLTGSYFDGITDIAYNGKWIFAACFDTNIRQYDFNQVIVHFK